MSLTGALSSSVSSLMAQSQAIAMVSDNLANSSTVGYKTTYASFESLVTGASSAGYSSGGVLVNSRSNVLNQGLLVSSTTSTNLAISGNGFFVVSDTSSDKNTYYTRNGEFTTDANGNLVNNGYYLMGWQTDSSGNVVGGENAGSLKAIDVDSISSTAHQTTEMTIQANLPANAATGDTFTNSTEVYDSLGTSHSLKVTWTKTGENSWTASFADPTSSSDTSTATGAVSSSAIAITFNSDGSLASTSPSPATLTISGWTDGAADSSITLNLGTANSVDGLTQYTSSASSPTVELNNVTSDGMAYGTLKSIAVGSDGIVSATYSNGQTIPIYKVPVATFANADGLEALSSSIYATTNTSGSAMLHGAGQGGAGSVKGSTLESSTTDTSQEFSSIITAQQAYSASAQVITAVNKMFDTLLSAVR